MTGRFPADVTAAAAATLAAARAKGLTISAAESCTGGLIGAALTDIAGSSDVYDRGFITYSYQSKTDILGVDARVLATRGAVSGDVAAAMATGALKASGADIVVAVTGIAGPGGATADKPVGLVYIATAAAKTGVNIDKNLFDGDRQDVRIKTVLRALENLRAEIAKI